MRLRAALTTTIAACAALVLVPSTARADASSGTPSPVLSTATGLSAPSSTPTAGATGIDQARLLEYVNSISALNAAVEYRADKNAPDTKLGAVTLQHGGDVSVHTSFSKKNGSNVATLDHFEVDASGLRTGPSINLGPIHTGPLVKIQKVEVNSKGEMSLKLNSWIPTITFKRIEHLKDGSIRLGGESWWCPLRNPTIHPNGDVTVHVGWGWFGFDKKVGHINLPNPSVLSQLVWPPTAPEVAGIVGALEQTTHGGPSGTSAGSTITKLQGILDWNVSASAHDPKFAYGNASGDATVNLGVSGEAGLKNGELTTTDPSKDKIHVDVALANGSINDPRAAVALKDAHASLDGTYSIDLPLQDSKHMKLGFDGHADVSMDATGAHLTLPNGASVQVGDVSLSDSGDVSFHKDGSAKSFALSNDHYAAKLSGPIHVAGLSGPVANADLDGTLTSTGTLDETANGGLALKGNLDGNETLTSDTTVALKNGTTTTVKAGSTVNLALGDVEATATAGDLAHGKPGKLQLTGESASGTVSTHAVLGDTKVQKNGKTIDLAATTVDASVTGTAGLKNGALTANGTDSVSAHATLGRSSLPVGKTNVDLTSGSLDVNENGSFGVNGKQVTASGNATAKVHGTIGDTKLPAGKTTIDLTSGTVDGSANTQFSFDGKKVTAHGTDSVAAHGNLGAASVPVGNTTVNVRGGTADVSENGSFGFDGKTVTGSGDVGAKVHGNLGDSKVPVGGTTVDVTGGTVDVTANGHASFDGKHVAANGVDATAKLHGNVGDVKLQNGPATVDLPSSSIDLTATAHGGIANGKVSGTANVKGGVKLTKDGSVDAGVGPAHLHSTIDAGTGVAIDATVSHAAGSNGTQVSGRILGALGGDTTVGAHSGQLSGTLNTNEQLGVNANFAGSIANGKLTLDPSKTNANVPVKIALTPGTQIAYGNNNSFTLTSSASYVQLDAGIAFGPNGQPKVQRIDNVDVVLAAGPSQVMILGNGLTVPPGNQVRVHGSVVFGPNGMTVVGAATVGVNAGPVQTSFTVKF